MKDGAKSTCYMPRYRVMEHAKRFSKSYDKKTDSFSGPWASDFDAMAKKTVLLQALKFVPKASEDANFAQAFTMDSTIRNGIEKDAATIKTEGIFAEGAVGPAPYDSEETAEEKPETKGEGKDE